MEIIEYIGRRGLKLSYLGELKNELEENFGGFRRVYNLYEFFKFNICLYNILTIKNILIIRINL